MEAALYGLSGRTTLGPTVLTIGRAPDINWSLTAPRSQDIMLKFGLRGKVIVSLI